MTDSRQETVIVLTGSPRKKGNCAILADQMIQELKKCGKNVIRFDAADMKVGPCHACLTCFASGKPCSFDDDFNAFAQQLEKADGIVYIMPLYWFGIPAPLKAVMDKCYCFFHTGKDLSGKKCALVSVCGLRKGSAFMGTFYTFQRIFHILHWNNVGNVLITTVNEPGDVLNTDGPERVRRLAHNFSSILSIIRN